jgi:hypothetical protein
MQSSCLVDRPMISGRLVVLVRKTTLFRQVTLQQRHVRCPALARSLPFVVQPYCDRKDDDCEHLHHTSTPDPLTAPAGIGASQDRRPMGRRVKYFPEECACINGVDHLLQVGS